MTDPIKWQTKQIKIADLKEYQHNPRYMSKRDFERLVKDIKQDGYHSRIIINNDNIIIGGHQRKQALLQAGFHEGDEIEVLVSSRTLTKSEIQRINIRGNLPFGKFDFDMLGNHFNIDELMDWGMPVEWVAEEDKVECKTEVNQDENRIKLCKKCPYKDKEVERL